MDKKRYFLINGELVDYNHATIHLSSVAIKYAASVFEGIRGYFNKEKESLLLFALDKHLDRLFDSMKLMKMDIPSTKDEIKEWVYKLIKANDLKTDCYVRCAASIEGKGGIDTKGPVLISIDAFPQGRKIASEQEGIHVCFSSWRRITDESMPPRIKCIANYQNGRLATIQANEDGYQGVLLLNSKGKVSEAPTACVFFVKNGMLITPSTTESILESITRSFVIELAKNEGIPVVEREIDRTESYLADECFLCGTGAEILPVTSIDRHIIGDNKVGKITRQIRDGYFNAVLGKNIKYKEWLK